MLGEYLQQNGVEIVHAYGNADIITQVTVQYTQYCQTLF